jgi:hypothetical protein
VGLGGYQRPLGLVTGENVGAVRRGWHRAARPGVRAAGKGVDAVHDASVQEVRQARQPGNQVINVHHVHNLA